MIPKKWKIRKHKKTKNNKNKSKKNKNKTNKNTKSQKHCEMCGSPAIADDDGARRLYCVPFSTCESNGTWAREYMQQIRRWTLLFFLLILLFLMLLSFCVCVFFAHLLYLQRVAQWLVDVDCAAVLTSYVKPPQETMICNVKYERRIL